jgi:hypothetical protein
VCIAHAQIDQLCVGCERLRHTAIRQRFQEQLDGYPLAKYEHSGVMRPC